nr:hypothetical protein [Candidatus Sigynarchaeum springense]
MGMYTKFRIDVMLKNTSREVLDTSREVIAALKYLETKDWWNGGKTISAAPGSLLHEQVREVIAALKYLETKDWWNGGKTISAAPGSLLHEQVDDVPRIAHPFWDEPRACMFKIHLDGFKLHAEAEIKNYEGEIEKFLDFISKHVKRQLKDGFYQYEEDPEPSKIVFNKDLEKFDIIEL